MIFSFQVRFLDAKILLIVAGNVVDYQILNYLLTTSFDKFGLGFALIIYLLVM
jgi:hypothetical protein